MNGQRFASCAVVFPFCVVLCVFVLLRSLGLFFDDREYTCAGKVCNIGTIQRRNNMKKWYFKYTLVFGEGNPVECAYRNQTVYQSALFRHREDAVNYSVLLRNNDTYMIKTYPTQTRDMLNLFTFLYGLCLLFVCGLACSTTSPYTERQRLLSCYA